MAFFRKNKSSEPQEAELKRAAEALENQAKWDELERLVSEQPDPKPTPTPLPEQEIETTSASNFSTDIKVDLPTESDLTPSITEIGAAAALAKITSSASFELGVQPEESEALTTENAADSPTSIKPEPNQDNYASTPPAVGRADRADIGAMRLDVARISADIQSGEELYRRAQQRIENLTGFVERAEIDFSMLNRLEPENRRLKARNRTIEREIEVNVQKMNVMRAELEDREHRLAEKTRVYETTLGQLSTAQKSLQEYERALKTTRDSSDKNALNAERLQTSLDVERRENEVLRDRVTEAITDVDVKQTSYIEARKIADSLAQDCSDYRQQAESAEKAADELRKSLTTAQTQNNAMKAEMVGLHEDIRTFKAQSEFTIISREDEMTALQHQIDHLTKQLDIKDEIVRNAARDVQELRKIRTSQDLERERLEAQIESQSFQIEQANAEILQTRQDVTDFDRRYRDVATALSVAQNRRTSNEPAETPDIQPAPPEAARPNEPEDLTGLSSQEIEDRIMEFRLGRQNDTP